MFQLHSWHSRLLAFLRRYWERQVSWLLKHLLIGLREKGKSMIRPTLLFCYKSTFYSQVVTCRRCDICSGGGAYVVRCTAIATLAHATIPWFLEDAKWMVGAFLGHLLVECWAFDQITPDVTEMSCLLALLNMSLLPSFVASSCFCKQLIYGFFFVLFHFCCCRTLYSWNVCRALMSLHALKLVHWVQSFIIVPQIYSAGFSSPTPIQAQTWPIALQGRDIVAIAKTGSGKTLGYLLPAFILLRQCRNNPQNGPTVLVLAPTRELATQIQDEAIKFGRSSRVCCTVSFRCCIFGVSLECFFLSMT